MFANDFYPRTCAASLSPDGLILHRNVPMKRTVKILDNELRLRSTKNTALNLTSRNTIGRFDELTHFFNLTYGLFRQSTFTFGLSTQRSKASLPLSNVNLGMNMHIDHASFEQSKVNLLKNVTFYSVLQKNGVGQTVVDDSQPHPFVGIVKFNTAESNLMLSMNYRWTPFLTSTLRCGTAPQSRLWSHVEYRHPLQTYELIAEYLFKHSFHVQCSSLSCLWKNSHCRLDGGLDLRVKRYERCLARRRISVQISSKGTVMEAGLRLQRASDSLVFKCDVHRPFERYLMGAQRYLSNNFTVGLLAEKVTDTQVQQPIKLSLVSQWCIERIDLRVNTLINTQNELGLALTQQIGYVPLVLQAFGLYSWTRQQYKWGVGLQLLL